MRTFPVLCLIVMWLSAFMPAAALPARVAGAPTAPAAAASAVLVPLPKAADTFTVGTLKVQRYGDHGRVVILIPGLECGPWEWARTIDHLKADHRVYALTLAGFDGMPAPGPDPGAGSLLDRADASLLELITTRHLYKPVLIGHSLGGTLSLRFAGEHAGLLSGVVAVDGLPIFPLMDRVGADRRKAIAARMRARMAKLTPAEFKAYELGYMRRMGVIDPAVAAAAAKRLARSDPKATAEYMYEDMASDYRPGLKRAQVPILEIAPYHAPDFEAAAKRTGHKVVTEAEMTAYYRQMLANAPDAKVVPIKHARHFVMLDQPRKFQQVLDGFLAGLPRS